MKKKLLSILTLFFTLSIYAQDIEIDTLGIPVAAIVYDCTSAANLYDSGGGGASYADNENFVLIICPQTAGYGVFASMLQMDIADGDVLNIYDGANTSAPLFSDMPLDENTNYSLNAQFQSSTSNTSGCLTFEFISNGDGNVGNFNFSLDCEPKCQTFTTAIGSSIPDTTYTLTDIYIDMCLGDTLFVTAANNFYNNNDEYFQSEASSTFEWYWSPNTIVPDMGQSQSHIYNAPGGYIGKLISYDNHGCRSYQDYMFKVRVAQPPEFEVLVDSILCFGALDTLTGLPVGIIDSGQIVNGDTVYFIPPVHSGDSTFLPDGNGSVYTSSVQVSGFDNNATILNCGSIIEVCINIEHSFLGDLDINLICPNGTSVALKTYPGGGSTFLGNPWDGAQQANGAGDGLWYCFSDNSTNGLLVNGPTQAATNTTGTTIVPDTYQPVDPFSNLVGCDINGTWSIEIEDNLTIDDGYIFDWSLNIDPCMYPDVDSFLMIYDFGEWESNPDIVDTLGSSNTIIVNPSSAGAQQFTYVTSDQFGCEYTNDYNLWVDSFVVTVTPDSSSFCTGEDTVSLTASVNVPSTCDYTIEMFDSWFFNDGWNNNTVTIFIDGVNSGQYTILNGSNYEIEPFTVANGQTVQIQYNYSGLYQNENAYNIIAPDGTIIFSDGFDLSGANTIAPASGVAFTFTAVCNSTVYDWSPNINISSLLDEQVFVWPTSSTNYVVEVVNDNACVSRDTAYIEIVDSMIITLTDDFSLCDGSLATLTATGADTYTWFPSTDLSATDQSMVNTTTQSDITYYVTFEISGCTETDSVVIDVLDLPQLDINNGINPVYFCEGDDIDLMVDNLTGWTYSWSPGTGNLATYTVNTEGNYTVVYNDGNCENSSTLNVIERPLPQFDFSGFDTILCCEDDEIIVTFADIVSNTTIQAIYINGVLTTDNSIIYTSQEDNFEELNHIRVVDVHGCDNTTDFPTVITKCANPSFTNLDTIFMTTSEIFDLSVNNTNASSTSYSWTTTDNSNNAITDASIEDATFNGVEEGIFTANVTVTNTYGNKTCTETAEANDYEVVEVKDPQYPDAFTPNGDEINNVYKPVVSSFAEITEFRIYNRWGSLVYDMATAKNKEGWDGTINGVQQQQDLYIYFITVNQPNKTFIKEGSVSLLR